MNLKGFKITGLIAVLAAIMVMAGFGEAQAGRKIISVDGSSTVSPITEAVAEEFQMANRGIMVTVGVSGTGGGFKKFCRGELDVADASRPIKSSEVAQCKKGGQEYIELPIAYDGLAIVVNPANDWAASITVKELKKIWEPAAGKKIMKWSQVRAGWPDEKIRLFAPGVSSGTFDYFTKAINGKEGASRADFMASEDDNILVQGVSNERYALGFFGIAYYEYNKDKLKLVPVDDEKPGNGKGPILPSLKTINNGTYQPLSRPIFIYVNKQKSADKPELKKFVEFYINNAGWLAEEVGYIPLSDNDYGLVLKKFQDGKAGSVFGGEGSRTGVKIEELLR